MKLFAPLSLTLTLLLTACTSSGYRNHTVQMPANGQVTFFANDVAFRPLIVPVLEAHGFTIVSNAAASVLACKASWKGFTSTRADISLWDGETKLASGSAANHGWGNWLAHAAAKQALIARAVEVFDQQLSAPK